MKGKVGQVVCVCGGWGGINVCLVLVGKPEGKRSLAGLRHEWEDNINMDLEKRG
jgi:hypothetical protein